MNYSTISADSHIDLSWMPGNLWVENAPSKYLEGIPKIVEKDGNLGWVGGGKELGPVGTLGFGFRPVVKGWINRTDRMFDVGFYDGTAHPTNPDLRLKDMVMDGVDAEVIYGITGVGLLFENPDLIRVTYEIYNSWVATFCESYPGRWAPLASIPCHDPQVAASELRRSAKLGLKGADFAASKAVKPIWHRDWDVLWEASAECRMPISFHVIGSFNREPDDAAMSSEYDLQYLATQSSLLQMGASEFLASIIFSGACDRYPEFKFVLGESGVTWLPHVLNRMDEQYDERYFHLNLSLRPSEFWHRQGYTTYQHELFLPEILPMVGEDNVMWGSDYPHPDGIWPDSQKIVSEDLTGLSEVAKRKITRDNAGKLYGFLK